jgi:hypothetical protein
VPDGLLDRALLRLVCSGQYVLMGLDRDVPVEPLVRSPASATLAARAETEHYPLSAEGLAGLQSAVGNSAVRHLLAGSRTATVQRFQIEGPWNINDPVHETLTNEALIRAGVVPGGTRYSDEASWEYTRGVMWNDDPQGELFDHRRGDDTNYSSGAQWYRHFSGAGRQATRRDRAGQPGFGTADPLLARSHYGDLQFIHGMAATDGELPQVTQRHMLLWAEFTYKVAIGVIPVTTSLGEVPVPGIPELFPRHRAVTVSALFGVLPRDTVGDVPQRAAGSLMHMIQDSFAGGHVEREARGATRRGRIISHHSYTGQEHGLHGAQDEWAAGANDADRIAHTLGAEDAVQASAGIMRLVQAGAPWEQAEQYLRTAVLSTVDTPQPAGPGSEFAHQPSTGSPPLRDAEK